MEEMIDVLDENGTKTGEILSRKEVHKRGLWHKVVVVAIIDAKNYILMQQRSYKKDTNPGKWDISVAGHVSSGQSPVKAAMREISEEVGMTVDSQNLQYILTYQNHNIINESYKDKQIYDCYIVRVKEIDMNTIVIQESEVEDAKIVSKEKFRQMVEEGNLVDRTPFYKELINYLFKT